VVTTEDAPAPEPELESAVEIWRIGHGGVDIPALIEMLDANGMTRVLVEGGGVTAAGFFANDLIDEIFTTVTRWVMGGDTAPTISDSKEVFVPHLLYDLVGFDTTEEEVFLHYRRRGDNR
jgi:2,5-diamino-6-(ribosylamino)-4(3H)-pyrimidinone 5'-phosphate reductase